jgi:hypothetical protein
LFYLHQAVSSSRFLSSLAVEFATVVFANDCTESKP